MWVLHWYLPAVGQPNHRHPQQIPLEPHGAVVDLVVVVAVVWVAAHSSLAVVVACVCWVKLVSVEVAAAAAVADDEERLHQAIGADTVAAAVADPFVVVAAADEERLRRHHAGAFVEYPHQRVHSADDWVMSSRRPHRWDADVAVLVQLPPLLADGSDYWCHQRDGTCARPFGRPAGRPSQRPRVGPPGRRKLPAIRHFLARFD